jgi:CRISPR-associated protein Csb1
VPRLIASIVRAYNVRELTRSAQYIPAASYVEDGLLDEPAHEKAKKTYAERGFVHVPASKSHGGVVATAGIRREATLHLAALRLLHAGGGGKLASGPSDSNGRKAGKGDATLNLRRYILGLALTAFTHPSASYLRQGCNLVRKPDQPSEIRIVRPDGNTAAFTLSHGEALAYATEAAAGFGIKIDRNIDFSNGFDIKVPFSTDKARREVADQEGSKDKAGKQAKSPKAPKGK